MKKKRWKILVLLGFLFTQTPIGLAEEEQSFKSEGVTGFYGTYEYPEAGSSSSEEGVGEPTLPNSTQDDQTPSGTTVDQQEAIQGDSKQLPKTGEYRSKQFTIIGSFLLLIVLIIIGIKRRRREK
ncbi:LPXTG cell wall anchor domain-containing protein [Enterococcus mundtii]|uniref:LPXTG cell wall anchor domain-containing protein n=1 Tax=Enterococcus TaxID=1350 RepID=UPI000A345CCC|nr:MULTISPECIES: LPXTG cell wall anchor domain-containing protein [Enterococcus]MDB7087838.1 LPXTG cell wall anchor domain-containing protein [Enterococcus mundtii]